MNDHPNITRPATPAAPVRPNLFATPAAGEPAQQRISVLASLSQTHQSATRKRRWPLFLGMFLGLCSVALLGFYLASRPAQKALPTPPMARQTTQVVAPAPQANTPVASSAPATNDSAPASIEAESSDTPLATLTRTAPAVAAASAASPTVTEETPTHAKRSLLKALSAPPQNQEKPTPPSKVKKHKSSADTDNVDTDVILLEALLSHTKSPDSISATATKKFTP